MINFYGMVPARDGSKGLPDKNITNISGRPLISYAIEPLTKCEKIKSVYLNSNSNKYLDIGLKWGAKKYKRKKVSKRRGSKKKSKKTSRRRPTRRKSTRGKSKSKSK